MTSAKLAPVTTVVVPPETVPDFTVSDEITKLPIAVAVSPNKSVTVNSVANRPKEVGVPVIRPVESRVNPAGKALPVLIETTLGPTPPPIDSAEVRAEPTSPTIDCGATIVGAAAVTFVLTTEIKFVIAADATATAAAAASADAFALVPTVVKAVSSAFNFFTAAISGVD